MKKKTLKQINKEFIKFTQWATQPVWERVKNE